LGLILVCLLVVLLVENSRIPFDDPNTHLELTMVHEVMVLDHSGPAFGMILYGAALKLMVLGALVVRLALPWQTGFGGWTAWSFWAGCFAGGSHRRGGIDHGPFAPGAHPADPDRHHPGFHFCVGAGAALEKQNVEDSKRKNFKPGNGRVFLEKSYVRSEQFVSAGGDPAQFLLSGQFPPGGLHPCRGSAGSFAGAAADNGARLHRPCPAAVRLSPWC
jgi:hypothetical protein